MNEPLNEIELKDGKIRKGELQIIALLSGFLRQFMERKEPDDCSKLIVEEANRILDYFDRQTKEITVQRDKAVSLLERMIALCKIKYGNLDKDVYEEILRAESFLKTNSPDNE